MTSEEVRAWINSNPSISSQKFKLHMKNGESCPDVKLIIDQNTDGFYFEGVFGGKKTVFSIEDIRKFELT